MVYFFGYFPRGVGSRHRRFCPVFTTESFLSTSGAGLEFCPAVLGFFYLLVEKKMAARKFLATVCRKQSVNHFSDQEEKAADCHGQDRDCTQESVDDNRYSLQLS